MVAGRAAVLASDSSGLVVAIDTDPRTPDPRRIIGSWALDGTSPSAPTVSGQHAFVNVAEGRVLGLDLAQPGPVRWRLPAGLGSLGSLAGEPAVGQRGIYVAGANGVLTCIEASTGRERWRCDLGQPVTGGLAARDGRVFVPVRSGQLWCFEEGED
ncbi:MAG: PQQ-like beta-propeller repeat protein [Planctomycetes bacterium]|nr:PQQ-like beta-propeller repeat protein [Planctomycetota bacterium]